MIGSGGYSYKNIQVETGLIGLASDRKYMLWILMENFVE